MMLSTEDTGLVIFLLCMFILAIILVDSYE
jgi:hypothetical protein